MDTSNPAVFVNAELLRMHVGRRVRAVIQVLRSDGGGSVIGKSTDEQQLVIKGHPSGPLSTFVEVIGIADSNQSIQAEIWNNFGDALARTKTRRKCEVKGLVLSGKPSAVASKTTEKERIITCCLPMPRTKASGTTSKSAEVEKPVEADEQVELGADNDMEETLEEEVEYEEVEEEVEEEEEEEDPEEDPEEEEVEDDEENDVDAHGTEKGHNRDSDMESAEGEEEVERKHAELLSLPPHGSEVYLGGISQDTSENELKRFCESIGEVTETFCMLSTGQDNEGKDTNGNKGYAFVMFRSKELASRAIKELNNTEFQVKAVYVKNLPKNVTQDQLKDLFEHHGKITKVVLPPAKPGQEKSRYGFVHFAERSSAMKALKNTEKYELDGQVVECSLAKPQADQKTDGGSNSHKSAILPTYPPHVGYGLVGAPYGALGAGYPGAGFAQPLIYGSGAPPGMTMMPMLLPDGRVGYVLQQPGAQPHTPPPQQRGRNSGGGSSSGGRRGGNGGRGRSRYSPY
ncbi:hypothetical protein DH2020_018123 [Rehmannia glutinosa]|uniref:RRM domain-containing protein n=1 Tax=Rehmannia glutinosa TaxID=99300 RepID=A0ABR0WKS6_REHGL